MDPWTAETRNEFIKFAIGTDEKKGQRGPYHFNTLSKVNGNDAEDYRRVLVTEALAKTIYTKKPAYRRLALGFYYTLSQKLSTNVNTGPYMGADIILMMKGGNAYAFVTEEKFPEDFQFSDLDVNVNINPHLPKDVFNYLERSVRIVVLQTISQYKRVLDHMLFLNRPIDDIILDEQSIAEFKKDYNDALKDIVLPNGAELMSPFESDVVRNYCSRNSFLITNSAVKEDGVMKIELPHFERCERIPLRKTPVFCSYNQTIDFVRDATQDECQGHFDLYRIRFNNRYIERDPDGCIIKEERVAADFIDVSIASQNDAELLDFWKHGKCLYINEKHSNIWIMVPDIMTCILDLYKMLNVYECPDGKRQKREQKYQRLLKIANLQRV